MKLLTKAIRERMPKLYATENEVDPIIQVKFFTPWSNWTWYAKEGEPTTDDDGNEIDYLFFGFVIGMESEWGYFSLNELETIRGPWGLKIERDMYFEPKRASEIKGIILYGKDEDE